MLRLRVLGSRAGRYGVRSVEMRAGMGKSRLSWRSSGCLLVGAVGLGDLGFWSLRRWGLVSRLLGFPSHWHQDPKKASLNVLSLFREGP